MNVPAEFRPGLIDALDQAINVQNRTQKKVKFGFSTSEDAITWTVFSSFARSDGAISVWRTLFGDVVESGQSLSLLLWGVPLTLNDERGWRLREQLERISDSLGEDPIRRTEPDVVIDAGAAGIVIVEVKYTSPNDVQVPSSRFDRYLNTRCFSDTDGAKATGLYELIRNWRFGCELAEGRRFTLVNLVREKHVQREIERTSRFASSLATDGHRGFALVEWERLLAAPNAAFSPALGTYLSNRFS